MIARLFRRKSPQLVTNAYKSAPITVNHVRYVKQPAVDPVAKAIAMAKAMGRNDLVERLEG